MTALWFVSGSQPVATNIKGGGTDLSSRTKLPFIVPEGPRLFHSAVGLPDEPLQNVRSMTYTSPSYHNNYAQMQTFGALWQFCLVVMLKLSLNKVSSHYGNRYSSPLHGRVSIRFMRAQGFDKTKKPQCSLWRDPSFCNMLFNSSHRSIGKETWIRKNELVKPHLYFPSGKLSSKSRFMEVFKRNPCGGCCKCAERWIWSGRGWLLGWG